MITLDKYRLTARPSRDGRTLIAAEDCENGNRVPVKLDRPSALLFMREIRHAIPPETVSARDLKAGDLLDLGDGTEAEVHMAWLGRDDTGRWVMSVDSDCGCMDFDEYEAVVRR